MNELRKTAHLSIIMRNKVQQIFSTTFTFQLFLKTIYPAKLEFESKAMQTAKLSGDQTYHTIAGHEYT